MNTLEIYRKLKESKFTKEQAEVIIETNNTELNNLATKSDITELKHELKLEINGLNSKINRVETTLNSKIDKVQNKIIYWILGSILNQIILTVTLIQLSK